MLQLNAKNKKNSLSSNVHVDTEAGVGVDIHVNMDSDVELNGSLNDVDVREISSNLSTTNGEIYNNDYNYLDEKPMEKVDVDEDELNQDMEMMQLAIGMAASSGGERGSHGPFPRPVCGAVLVSKDGRVSKSIRREWRISRTFSCHHLHFLPISLNYTYNYHS